MQRSLSSSFHLFLWFSDLVYIMLFFFFPLRKMLAFIIIKKSSFKEKIAIFSLPSLFFYSLHVEYCNLYTKHRKELLCYIPPLLFFQTFLLILRDLVNGSVSIMWNKQGFQRLEQLLICSTKLKEKMLLKSNCPGKRSGWDGAASFWTAGQFSTLEVENS